MSLRFEQYNSLKKTRKFLQDLLHHSTRPKKVSDISKQASSCLRHFPFLKENGEPMFSNDNFNLDKNNGLER
jgi:hypothetical protein